MSVKDVKHQPPKSLLLTLSLQFAQTNMPLTITSAVNLQQWVASMTKIFQSFFLNMKLLFLISRECGKKRREHFSCFSKNCKESNCFVVSMYKVGDILEGLDKLDKKNDESLHSCINFPDDRERATGSGKQLGGGEQQVGILGNLFYKVIAWVEEAITSFLIRTSYSSF